MVDTLREYKLLSEPICMELGKSQQIMHGLTCQRTDFKFQPRKGFHSGSSFSTRHTDFFRTPIHIRSLIN